jgi:hypothetical protein
MSGINSGVLRNAYPLTPELIKELEGEVLNSNAAYVYLDENGKLSFMMPSGIDGIKDLAWDNGYELSTDDAGFTKKVYAKTGLKTFVLKKVLSKQNIDDSWSESEVPAGPAPGLYDADGNLVASWNTLVEEYGMNAEGDFSSTYSSDVSSPCRVLKKAELSSGVHLVIGNVTQIGNYAFYSCSQLISVTLPDSVTSIGDSAFRNCRNLQSVYYTGSISQWCAISFYDHSAGVCLNGAALYIDGEIVENLTIPEGVTSISKGAFAFCSTLKSVTIPDSVTSIEKMAFYYCKNLETVNISQNSHLQSIGDDAFNTCTNLTSFNIPNSVTTIGTYAFRSCSSLTNITIPDGITKINNYSFTKCSSITTINIPDGVTSIGNSAFSGCPTLATVVISENSSLTSIGEYAFSSCEALTEIKLPNTITTIGKSAFFGCSNLVSADISALNLTTINQSTFQDCASLTSVTIPDSVTSLGKQAFSNCTSLETVLFGENSQLATINSNAF